MATKKLAKIPSSVQSTTDPVDEPRQEPGDDQGQDSHLAGLAGYLASASQTTHDRFELQEMAESSEAARRVLAGLRRMVDVETDRKLSRWIRSHPDKKTWEEEPPAPRKGTFHDPQEREAIRRAYEQFGCDMCGTKERPHMADGLCRRCYNVRSYRRRKALTFLKDEERRAAQGATVPAIVRK